MLLSRSWSRLGGRRATPAETSASRKICAAALASCCQRCDGCDESQGIKDWGEDVWRGRKGLCQLHSPAEDLALLLPSSATQTLRCQWMSVDGFPHQVSASQCRSGPKPWSQFGPSSLHGHIHVSRVAGISPWDLLFIAFNSR